MTLKTFSNRLGVHYKTVYGYWNKGMLNAFQLPTGMIIVDIRDTDPLENAFKDKVVKKKRIGKKCSLKNLSRFRVRALSVGN